MWRATDWGSVQSNIKLSPFRRGLDTFIWALNLNAALSLNNMLAFEVLIMWHYYNLSKSIISGDWSEGCTLGLTPALDNPSPTSFSSCVHHHKTPNISHTCIVPVLFACGHLDMFDHAYCMSCCLCLYYCASGKCAFPWATFTSQFVSS